MPAGLEYYAPNGALWFSAADITTRTVGVYTVTSENPPLPRYGAPNHEFYTDFLCPATAEPWAYALGTNGLFAVFEVLRVNSAVGRLKFNLGFNTSTFPPGGSVTFYFGWGQS